MSKTSIIGNYINKKFNVYYDINRKKYIIKTKCNKCNKESIVTYDIMRESIKTYLKNTNNNIDEYNYWCKKCSPNRYHKGTYIFKEKRNGYLMIRVKIVEDKFKPMLRSHGKRDINVYGDMPLHRYIMAKHLDRCLKPFEVVHHINGDKTDNRIENLELVSPQTHNAITKMESIWEKRIKELEEENNRLKQKLNDLGLFGL